MDPSGAGWCVTTNLEKGHLRGTLPWLERALAERPAMVFAQELNRRSTVESLAATYGYHPVVWPARVEPRWWMVSWIMVRDDLVLEPLEEDARRLLVPFSSYVAAARVGWPPLGSIIVLSVHASPNVVTEEDLGAWPAERPEARSGGVGVPRAGRLLYADLVIAALRELTADGPVLAAGDLNEARGWDERHPGHTWGEEFFAAVADAGLVDVTWGLWGEERPTRIYAEDLGYQLDRVLASPDVARLVRRAQLDPYWMQPNSERSQLADHVPVWFELHDDFLQA